MKHGVTFVLGVALLVALVMLDPRAHGPLAVVVFAIAWAVDREVARGLGKPRAWLVAMIVLVGLGAWLGPKAGTGWQARLSVTGALAGVTMAARAIGLLLATTAITRSVSPERLLARLKGSTGRALAGSVVVALRLAPEMGPKIKSWAAEARVAHPGILRGPRRAFEVLVRGVEHATTIADEVAVELSTGSREK